VKGTVRWQAAATTTTIIGPGSMGDFAVHASVYGEVQVGPSVVTQRQIEREEEGKEACLIAQAGLSSYLYRLLVACVHLPVLGVISTPPHYQARLFGQPVEGATDVLLPSTWMQAMMIPMN
jgi:hypothetical protein